MDDPNEDEDLIPPDVRRPQRLLDSRRQADGELSDSDDEGEDGRRDHQSHRESEVSRRFGTATGIMQTGSTHGIGPTMTLPVSTGNAAAAGASGPPDEMEVDEDDAPLAETVRAKSKRPESSRGNSMAVDPPAAAPSDAAPAPTVVSASEPSEAPVAKTEAAPSTS
jgi:histone deacetylase 1/2